ncbi:MAG: aldehyde dehydrogenase [Ahrensia sp.]|nr:aldehyde dehydrogenase [Ahrensia sp.]
MNDTVSALVAQYRETGRIEGLPDRHLIAGDWTPSANCAVMDSIDPGNGAAFHQFAAGDAADIDRAVENSHAALNCEWRSATPAARGSVIARAAVLIRQNAARLAVAESLDSGKPLQEAEGDVAGAARCFEYYAGLPDKFEGRSIPLGPDYLAYTEWEPVGVTAHIVPWNYPISTLSRSIAPALAAGCSAVVKPAEQTPLTALMLGELLLRAGLPAGVVNVVTGTGKDAGAPLVSHPLVRHVSFTGSTATGIEVIRAAARNVTSVLPELGGKSPLVVLADADMDAAADGIIGAIYENAGQICSAGSRLIVERKAHAGLMEALVSRARALKLGHGLNRPDMGPVSSAAHLARIATIVHAARERGLEIATGGAAATDPETGKGWFYEPTIINNVPVGDPVAQEEIFGPVLAVQIAEDVDEAIFLANSTQYALVAGVYTRDFSAAHRLARRIDAGQVFINEYFAGGISVPFGGNRMSGFGREKGIDGMRTYLKLKSVAARIS